MFTSGTSKIEARAPHASVFELHWHNSGKAHRSNCDLAQIDAYCSKGYEDHHPILVRICRRASANNLKRLNPPSSSHCPFTLMKMLFKDAGLYTRKVASCVKSCAPCITRVALDRTQKQPFNPHQPFTVPTRYRNTEKLSSKKNPLPIPARSPIRAARYFL